MGGPGSGRKKGSGNKSTKESKTKKVYSPFSDKAAERRWNNRRTQTSKTRTK